METVDPSSFDVFISYKNSDENGELTQDAKLAFALHDALEAQGIKTFCSTLSLTRMGQSAYKDAINQALDAARIMVVVGTSVDNILSPWIKYEWGTFHDDLLTGRKTTGTLVSCISGMNPNDLPRELRSYEAFPLEQGGGTRIIEFIQACMENRVELGYAGTALRSNKLPVIKANTRRGLVNAQDPDETAVAEKKSKAPIVAIAAVALLLICGVGGYAVYTQQEAAAVAEKEAQAAEQKAAQEQADAEEKARQEQEYAETHSDYTVKYLVKDTNKELKKSSTVKDAEVGSKVTLKAVKKDGYTLSSVKGATLSSSKDKATFTVSKKDKENVIIFYYTKDQEPEPSYDNGDDDDGSSYTGGGSGSGSGSGGGSTSSGGNNGGGSSSGGGSNGGGDKKVPKDWIVD